MSSTAQLVRKLMESAGRGIGLDYDQAVAQPGTSDDERAFLLLSRGASLLLALEDENYFPSLERRVRSKGARRIAQAFERDEGKEAASFLAQALAGYVACLRPDQAAHQHQLSQLVQARFPARRSALEVLGPCRSEFEVMTSHALRPGFAFGLETGTGYHLALQRGEDPDLDDELVAIQTNYAAVHFAIKAEREAIHLAAPKIDSKLGERLLHSGQSDLDALTLYRMRPSLWNDEIRYWDNYASRHPVFLGDLN